MSIEKADLNVDRRIYTLHENLEMQLDHMELWHTVDTSCWSWLALLKKPTFS